MHGAGISIENELFGIVIAEWHNEMSTVAVLARFDDVQIDQFVKVTLEHVFQFALHFTERIHERRPAFSAVFEFVQFVFVLDHRR